MAGAAATAAPAPSPAAAWLLDGKGGMAPTAFPPPVPQRGVTLIVGSPDDAAYLAWLTAELGEETAATLATSKTSPHCTVVDERILLVLKLGREQSAAPQPVAVVIEKQRIIVATRLDLERFLGLSKWVGPRRAPVSSADFVARLGLRAADRLEPLVEKVGDGLDTLEQALLAQSAPDIRRRLGEHRRTIISLRRAIWPQRDAIDSIEVEDVAFLTDKDRIRLREVTSRLERLEAELRALSERSVLVHESLMDARAERMNRIILVLTAVTVVFTPLTLITGLLGMNVGGLPFGDAPWAFWAVIGIMAVLAIGIVLWMRTRKWL